MKLFYARHGQPAVEYHKMTPEQLADERNVSISEEGLIQAQNLGGALRDKKIAHILYSPFQRTFETAREIYSVLRSERQSPTFQSDARLVEVFLGEGNEKRKNLLQWYRKGVAENAETVQQSRLRLRYVLADIRLGDGNTLIVAHQSLGLVLELEMNNFPDDTPVSQLRTKNKLDYCGLLQWDLLDDLRLVEKADS